MEKHEVACNVKFDGTLVTEATGECAGYATPAQVSRSYSAGNPTITIERSSAWLKENCPLYYTRYCEAP